MLLLNFINPQLFNRDFGQESLPQVKITISAIFDCELSILTKYCDRKKPKHSFLQIQFLVPEEINEMMRDDERLFLSYAYAIMEMPFATPNNFRQVLHENFSFFTNKSCTEYSE